MAKKIREKMFNIIRYEGNANHNHISYFHILYTYMCTYIYFYMYIYTKTLEICRHIGLYIVTNVTNL